MRLQVEQKVLLLPKWRVKSFLEQLSGWIRLQMVLTIMKSGKNE